MGDMPKLIVLHRIVPQGCDIMIMHVHVYLHVCHLVKLINEDNIYHHLNGDEFVTVRIVRT